MKAAIELVCFILFGSARTSGQNRPTGRELFPAGFPLLRKAGNSRRLAIVILKHR